MSAKNYFFNFPRLGISAYRSDIGPPEDRYMLRWIFRTPWGMARVHKILRSDAADEWHDHPAWLLSLGATYREEVVLCLDPGERESLYARHRVIVQPVTVRQSYPLNVIKRGAIFLHWRHVRWWNFIPARRFHRVVLLDEDTLQPTKPCWTFCLMGPLDTKKRWGFLSKEGVYTDFEVYLREHEARA